MKHLLLTTIAAVLLVGCASEPEYSESYSLTVEGTTIRFQLKSDGSFIGSPEGVNDDAVGTWKVEGDLLVCEGTTARNSNQITVKFDKTTFKLISLAENGEEEPLDRMIPEGENGIYLRKSQQSAPAPETAPVEPVAESAQTEPPTAKAPDISIHKAAEAGNIEEVKQHLAAGADLSAQNGDFKWTPLHVSASKGHKDIVELFIAKAADVNAINIFGETPLHRASLSGHGEVVELLITNGADVNVQDINGTTSLDWAVFSTTVNKTEIADLLRKHGGKTRRELKAAAK